ncbi:hypothetical protein [Streptomyces sp. NPDC003393]
MPLLSRATTLVTLTIGGNDMGLSRGMEACLPSDSSDADCDRALEEAERVLREELPGAPTAQHVDSRRAGERRGIRHVIAEAARLRRCPEGVPGGEGAS